MERLIPAALCAALILSACSGTSATPTGDALATAEPVVETATPTLESTVTPTPTVTPGPGLAELLATPNARAAAADLDGAVADYQALAEIYPHKADPWLGLAAIAQRRQDWTSALEYLETAASAEPDNPEAFRQWALLLEARGDYAGLADVYDQMITLTPDDPNLLVARAQAYARTGRADDALADLKSAEGLDPNREFAWLNVAGAAYGVRQYQSAIDIASAGLEAHDESTGLLMQRGLAYMSMGDLALALEDFDAAIRLDKTLPAAYHWKGRAQIAQGKYAEAAETLKQAADLGVQSGVKDVNLAYESMAFAADALARDNINTAFSYLAEKVILYGSRDPLLMGYGFVRWRQGSPDQAIGRMDALVKAGYPPALYWRGVYYAEQGDRGNAMIDLKYFLTVEHSGPDVESARSILTSLGVDPDEGSSTP